MKAYVDWTFTSNAFGWLPIELINGNTIYLPPFLEVEIENRDENYEYFIIKEGVYKWQHGKVRHNYYNRHSSSHFTKDRKVLPSAKLIYKQDQQTLELQEVGFVSVAHNSIAKPKNSHVYLEIPSFPHIEAIPKEYLIEESGGSKLAQTWFRLCNVPWTCHNHQFLHFGKISKGCITVSPRNEIGLKWTTLCTYLLACRLNEKIVGEIIWD